MKLKLVLDSNNNASYEDLFSKTDPFEVEIRGSNRAVLEFMVNGNSYSMTESSVSFEEDCLLLEGAISLPSSFLGRFLFRVVDLGGN